MAERLSPPDPESPLGLLEQAQEASRLGGWDQRDPKEVIDSLMDEIPDDLPRYSVYQLDALPPNQPSQLELFFLSRRTRLPDTENEKLASEGVMSMRQSMDCLRDGIRTKRLLKGIAEAIKELEASTEGTIRVYDAGPGALAVTSIYAALCSDRVDCTALEAHRESANFARGLVETIGLWPQILVLQAEATSNYPEEPIDLLISETMHSGLIHEPFVQIMSRLHPHVREGGIALPSLVTVEAALVPVEKYLKAEQFVSIMGESYPIMEADWNRVVEYRPGDPLDEISFALPTDHVRMTNPHLFVTSEVEIGPRQSLGIYQSQISMPQPVWVPSTGNPEVFSFGPADRRDRIGVRYKPGQLLQDVVQLT